jgi:phenylpropionate dioxygenase-like ring-hydroxylating dioxygenase large terminal subunit
MLSKEENELLTRTGPGTPMGEVFRRYWVPAALAEELPEADGAPVRVRLLGERLIAFRDSTGRVGLLDEFCAHRGASLWLGRNEECGLRCIYHGWKYDADGNCLDMMNEPEAHDFKRKIHLKSYPTLELGGIIWTYMGPPEKRPEPPWFEFTQVPAPQRHAYKTWEECNWLQALEGGIDSSHAPILHRALKPDPRYGIPINSPFVQSKAPILDLDVTDYGYMYASVRPLAEGQTYIRPQHYVLPFTQIRQGRVGREGEQMAGHLWVPMDDENCMVYHWLYNLTVPLDEEDLLEPGSGRDAGSHLPGYRKMQNKDNGWGMDRAAQKTETFSGIWGINNQDHAVQESMGAVVDRSREHLGPSDKGIIVARRLLLQTVKTVQQGGDPPALAAPPYALRANDGVVANGTDWRTALREEIFAAV